MDEPNLTMTIKKLVAKWTGRRQSLDLVLPSKFCSLWLHSRFETQQRRTWQLLTIRSDALISTLCLPYCQLGGLIMLPKLDTTSIPLLRSLAYWRNYAVRLHGEGRSSRIIWVEIGCWHLHLSWLLSLMMCQSDDDVQRSLCKINYWASQLCNAEMLETLAEDVFYKILDLVDVRTRANVILVNKTCNRVATVNWRVLELTTQRNDDHVSECLEEIGAQDRQSLTSVTIKVNWTHGYREAFLTGKSAFHLVPTLSPYMNIKLPQSIKKH